MNKSPLYLLIYLFILLLIIHKWFHKWLLAKESITNTTKLTSLYLSLILEKRFPKWFIVIDIANNYNNRDISSNNNIISIGNRMKKRFLGNSRLWNQMKPRRRTNWLLGC